MSAWTKEEAEIAIDMWTSRKFSARNIAERLKNKTRNQVISFMGNRDIPGGLPLHNQKGRAQKHSYTNRAGPKTRPSILGLVHAAIHDKSRITLISIPSIAEAETASAYSYISRDQSRGMKMKAQKAPHADHLQQT